MNQRSLLHLTALLGALSVALGAFGAHSLERLVAPEQVETFVTGVRYQFYHTLAIGLATAMIVSPAIDGRRLTLAVRLWIAGIALFSGSLYLLSLGEVHGLPVGFLGPITPIGGVLLIAGWVTLFFATRNDG